MSSRVLPAPALLASLVAVIMLLVAPASGLAHGEEGEAAAEAPARTLVQQALALLTQQENEVEAQEKLELALESKDQKDVDIPAVREALAALEKDDHAVAEEHMNVALGAEETPAGEQAGQDAGAAHEEGGAAAEEVPEESLEHSAAFEPDRGSEEWIALVVGVALVIAAFGVLFARRRTV